MLTTWQNYRGGLNRSNCCQKGICADCVLYNTYVCMGFTPACYTCQCPLCPERTHVHDDFIMEIMAERCPRHAILIDTCMGEKATVAHLPCANGCYTCQHATLEARLI